MRNLFQLILLVFLLGNITNNQAQCVYTTTASTNGHIYNDTAIVCSGSALNLVIQQSNCPRIHDNFNSGKPDTSIFIQNSSLMFTNPCGSAALPASGLVAWMGSSAFPREIKTKTLNLINTSTIEWDMKYGNIQNSSNCEPPDDPSEGVSLEYSVDSGLNWIQFPGTNQAPSGVYGSLNYINGSGGYWMPVSGNLATGPYYSWNHYISDIPADAKTSHTMIRWFQAIASNSNSDNWGIDNLSILNCPLVIVVWSNGLHTMNPPAVYPTSNTFYSFILTDSSQIPVFILKDTIWVKVINSIPTSSFSLVPHICAKDTAIITYTGNAPLSENFHWDFGNWSNVLEGSGAGPYKISWYNIFQDSLIQSVKLIINENSACASPITTHTIVVYPNTELAFWLSPSFGVGCVPLNISVINETVPAPNLQTLFTWYFGDGSTSNSISPSHTYQNPGFYNFTVECLNSFGCFASWTGIDLIHVLELPPTPIITKIGDTLYCDNNLNINYQWYMNDSIILFANNYYYIPTEIAYYTVITQNENGCLSLPSNKILSIDQSGLLAKDVLMPNPANTYFSIKFNKIVNQVDILNINGMLLKTYIKANPYNIYTIDELSNGLYLVKIYVNDIISMQKLIKY